MPRIDAFGWNKQSKIIVGDNQTNVLSQSVKIPNWWSKPGLKEEEKKTLTGIQEQRRQEKRPHISYDLDGDGLVGGRDYVLAKIFDKDQDGRLNSVEKQNAIDAINNGFEQNFVWNVEVSGGQRPYRLLQKRGVFVDAEDFMPVRTTYPVHPDTIKSPQVRDKKALQEIRKQEYKKAVTDQKKKWEELNPPAVEMPYIQSEFLIENPTMTSITQRKEDHSKQAREKAGLSQKFIDIKDNSKDPGLNYIDKPPIYSKKVLEQRRREELRAQEKELEKKQETHELVEQRIKQRENCHLRLGYKENSGKTKGDIDKLRKKEVIENLTSKYGNQTVGIHGQELPKFNGFKTQQEWWKNTKSYNPIPNVTSALTLRENQKLGRKDEMKLNDVEPNTFKPDPFKTNYNKQVKKDIIALKVNTLNHWTATQGEQAKNVEFLKGYAKSTKWSEQDNFYRCRGDDRLFDKIIKQAKAYEKDIAEVEVKREIHNQPTPDKQYNYPINTDREVPTNRKGKEVVLTELDNSKDLTKVMQKDQTQISPAGNVNKTLNQTTGTISQNNQTFNNMSLLGKTTLFSRFIPTQQNNQEKVRLAAKSQNYRGDKMSTNNMSMLSGSTTANYTNQMGKTQNSLMMANSFKEATQKGVLSGIGLLKK